MKQLTKVHFVLNFEATELYLNIVSLKDAVRRHVEEKLGYKERENIEEGQVIYFYIQGKVKEHFESNRGYEVVVTNYSERKGSFIVEFSLAIIGVIADYESFYKSLELLVDDLRKSLHIYNDNFTSRVSFNEEFGYVNYRNAETQLSQTNMLSKIKYLLPVVFILLSVVGIFDDEIFSHFNNEAGIESPALSFHGVNDYEYYIEKQVKEEMAENHIHNSRAFLERELRQAEFERDTVKQELIEELQSQLGISMIESIHLK